MYTKFSPAHYYTIVILLLATLACSLSLPSLSDVSVLGQPTEAPTATPETDSISFQTLTYRISMIEGERVPGTGLVYKSKQESGFEVEIDGLQALKRSGDSFSWRGVVSPGVIGKYDLRITTTLLGELIALGPVQINILNPAPIELNYNQPPPAALQYDELLIDYRVPIGEMIPGTTITYMGLTDQGGQLAGTSGYPYIRQADSFSWIGQIRDNVIVRYDLRVTSIGDDNIRLVGTARLWIY